MEFYYSDVGAMGLLFSPVVEPYPLGRRRMSHLYKTLFREEVIGELLAMLVKVGWLVLLVFIILRGWGIYNYYLFGRRNRRKNYPVTSASEIGRHFGLTEEEVRSLQQKKEIVWTELYDEDSGKDAIKRK